MTDIVPATADMMTAFYGRPPQRSQRAFAFVRDERVIGIFGLYADGGRMVLFSDLTPELRTLKKTLVKGMRFVMGVAKQIGAPVHACADEGVEGSEKLLTRHGFQKIADDVYEFRSMREKVHAAEAVMRELPQLKLTPKHHFAKGTYGRELFIPKDACVTGKIHKYSQLNVLMSGDLSVLTEEGVIRVTPPFAIVSPPGTKRIVYAHEDSIWLTVHGTNETDLEKIEETFIAQSEAEYLAFCALQIEATI